MMSDAGLCLDVPDPEVIQLQRTECGSHAGSIRQLDDLTCAGSRSELAWL